MRKILMEMIPHKYLKKIKGYFKVGTKHLFYGKAYNPHGLIIKTVK
jgi:hypothetical protein